MDNKQAKEHLIKLIQEIDCTSEFYSESGASKLNSIYMRYKGITWELAKNGNDKAFYAAT